MRKAAIAGVVVAALLVGTAYADGPLGRKPYRYLHPPPALKSTNKKPLAGDRLISLTKGTNASDLTHFTKDGQAGLGMHAGTLRVGPPAKQLDLAIRPVNLPAPLPKQYQQDGNAYRFAATGRPGGKSAQVVKPIGFIFRWAQLPYALLVYSQRRWRTVCNVTSKDWQIDSLVVACHTSTLGTFTLVRRVYR